MDQEIVIRRIKRKEFARLFKITGETSNARTVTGLSEQRFWRIAKLYRLVEIVIPVLGILHKDIFDTILVAASRNEIVGEIHLVPLGRRIWVINSAAVDPTFGGRGVFKNLMRQGLRYISARQGERVFGSFRTDIIAVDKVMVKLFGFEIFEKLLLLQLKLHQIPNVELDENTSIREANRSDAERIYQLTKSISPNKTQIRKTAPSDFLDSSLGRVANRLMWSDSRRWVMEVQGKIVGYTRFTYTPPQESGELESFYVLPSNESLTLVRSLLGAVLKFLYERNIRKIVVYLDEEWKPTIETFEGFGFKPVASYYNTVKRLRTKPSCEEPRRAFLLKVEGAKR
jgi:ribosomal protein S18 acetylase RimI-like enzyme